MFGDGPSLNFRVVQANIFGIQILRTFAVHSILILSDGKKSMNILNNADIPLPSDADIPLPRDADIPLPSSASIPLPSLSTIRLPDDADIPLPNDADIPLPSDASIPLPADKVCIELSLATKGAIIYCKILT